MSKIAILLSTYNGEKYLKQQLDSLENQTFKDFEIIARDDGSSDDSLDILQSYDFRILQSKSNIGVKASFATLLEYALENSESEYFMFCDQDDVWNDDKVEKTLLKMQELEKIYGKDTPMLVHTDLEVVDENLVQIHPSFMKYQKLDYKKNSLNSLLVQNTVTGCTIMINRKLATISLPIPNDCMMHDWWIALVASCFGKIGYLDESTIKYRQHTQNSVGAKGYNFDYIKKNIFKKDAFEKNILQAKAFLDTYDYLFSDEQREILESFIKLKNTSFLKKRFLLFKYKFFKHGMIRNIGLFLKI